MKVVMAKRIAILGSTGSIGKNALQVIEALGGDYEVTALTAHSSFKLLAQQVRKFKPKYVALTNTHFADRLRNEISGLDVEVLVGPDSLVQICQLDQVDTVVTAIVGAAGLPAVLAAAKKGKRLAIANKEPLVIAGQLLMETARASGAEILPVDSEHSAIFQAMHSASPDEVSKIILTTSGGPFRQASITDIEKVTLKDALNHPVWDMGPKITIDSATMMNKALEVIEARWLFNVPVEKIEVLVHPESIVHSMVEFVDGSIIAQLGTPDMCLPIQYALTYPKRLTGIGQRLQLEKIGSLNFSKPNMEVFRALKLAFEVAKQDGSAPVVFNAANEAAVEQFLAGRIKFNNIVELIEHCLDKHEIKTSLSLEELLEIDRWARNEVIECLNQKTR